MRHFGFMLHELFKVRLVTLINDSREIDGTHTGIITGIWCLYFSTDLEQFITNQILCQNVTDATWYVLHLIVTSRIRNGRFKNRILCQVPVAVTFMFYHLPEPCMISSTVTLNNRCLWIVCLYCDMLRSSRSNSTATIFRFSELCVLSVAVCEHGHEAG